MATCGSDIPLSQYDAFAPVDNGRWRPYDLLHRGDTQGQLASTATC